MNVLGERGVTSDHVLTREGQWGLQSLRPVTLQVVYEGGNGEGDPDDGQVHNIEYEDGEDGDSLETHQSCKKNRCFITLLYKTEVDNS